MAKSTKIAHRYATAWLDAAVERGVLEDVRTEIEGLRRLIDRSAELAAFFQDRMLTVQVKQHLLTSIFQGKTEEITLNFLLLLIANRREFLLPTILDACHALLDERDGIVVGRIRSAVEMPAEQQAALRARLEAYTGKRVRMITAVDSVLIGGFVAVVSDTVFDGSVATQLKRVKRALVGR